MVDKPGGQGKNAAASKSYVFEVGTAAGARRKTHVCVWLVYFGRFINAVIITRTMLCGDGGILFPVLLHDPKPAYVVLHAPRLLTLQAHHY